MPTSLPTRIKPRAPHSYAKLARLFAAFIYLLLLAWNVSALEADFASIAPADAHGAYNPMEPTGRERFALGGLEIR